MMPSAVRGAQEAILNATLELGSAPDGQWVKGVNEALDSMAKECYYIGYEEGQSKGYTDGYDDGYQVGQDLGRTYGD